MVEHKINGPHHHGEVVLEQNIVLGPEQNVMEMLVPEFDNNYNYLQPVNGQAMLPVELEMLYGPNPNQELQFGSGYNFYNPFAVFVNNQEQDLIHIEVNSPHNNEFEPHGLMEMKKKICLLSFRVTVTFCLHLSMTWRLIVADFTKDKASPSYPSKNKQTFINLVFYKRIYGFEKTLLFNLSFAFL